MLLNALTRPVLFVGGKGGVGKTTIASAIGLRAVDEGRRVLLVSTDPAHSVGDVLDTAIGSTPRPVRTGFWACEIDPAAEADRYIEDVKSRVTEATSPRLMREVERQIDVARVSPGAEEAALFDRFTRMIDELGVEFDHIVFDTAPTGHTLRLLTLPEHMALWVHGLIGRRRRMNVLQRMWRNVGGGNASSGTSSDDPVMAALEARRARFERARAVMTDPERAGFIFVLIPERLPIAETERAVQTLTQHGIPVAGVIVNRVLPADADGRFLEQRRQREAEYMDRIERTFADVPLEQLPLLESDVVGLDMLRRLGRLLFSEQPGAGRT